MLKVIIHIYFNIGQIFTFNIFYIKGYLGFIYLFFSRIKDWRNLHLYCMYNCLINRETRHITRNS